MKENQFTSRAAAILTLLGVAIGLGNVWRFPYMMGQYGGSAFLVVYLLLTLLFAFPALMAELTLGRKSKQGTVAAFQTGFGKFGGTLAGYFFIVVVTIAGSYYAVVVGNVLYLASFSVFPGFDNETLTAYTEWLGKPALQYGFTLALILASVLLIRMGLITGTERFSRKFMPLFFMALIYMIIHALTLPGSIEKFALFLRPDFSQLGVREIFAALGQAFFSVGLGGTFIVVYAGYLGTNEKLPGIAFVTAFGDASASLLFSLFLIPSLLVFNMDMTQGPQLIFQTLPDLFAHMPGGRIVAPLFLFPIAIVAFLSLVAAYQVPFTTLTHEWPRMKSSTLLILIAVVQAILAIPSVLSSSLIGKLDLIFGSGMQVLGSALCVICLTWCLSRSAVLKEMFNQESAKWWQKLLYLWIQWIVPFALLAVLASYILDAL